MQDKKVILITGSSKGIGAGLAGCLVRDGHSVIINHHRSTPESLKIVNRLNTGPGTGQAELIPADVTRREDVRRMFDQAVEAFGQVDVLINNAGRNIDRPFLEMSEDDWREVIDINLTGTFLCCREFASRYQGESGHIINMGATTAFRGRKNGANYCSAKAGVITLTKCLALELAPRILVNCLVPGWVDTEELRTRYRLDLPENLDPVLEGIPLQRLGTAGDIYAVVNFLVSASTYITGQNFFINGGWYTG